MKTIKRTIDKRRWWGPVEFEMSNERTVVRMPDGVQVELWCPLWQEGGLNETLEMLKAGLPVRVNGEIRVVLRQPERKVWHRRNRKILVEGDREVVPPGLFFRARWARGVSLESSVELGAERDERLIRPPADILLGFPLYGERVDRSLSSELIGLWSCVENRLVMATHIL